MTLNAPSGFPTAQHTGPLIFDVDIFNLPARKMMYSSLRRLQTDMHHFWTPRMGTLDRTEVDIKYIQSITSIFLTRVLVPERRCQHA